MSSRSDYLRRHVYRRQLGFQNSPGTTNKIHSQLYSDIKCLRTWDPVKTSDDTHHGGIFNFDFSTDGSLLVAACEKESVLMFDPFNGKKIATKNKAHSDCVNCVRFLDTRTFATCSDDTTVCLWDARYLKQPIRTLRGHSNWVKNIEYDRHHGVLVTSGFDGSIYTWDINSYSDNGVSYKQVFNTEGLMRSKLTPDASKLVIATSSGYMMIIHDLDLYSLRNDLLAFQPDMYRDISTNNAAIRESYLKGPMFTRSRNRVEFIMDFPDENDAEMIASLEIHPQGWCVVSRNISRDENTEWTCVHDIQKKPSIDYSEDLASADSREKPSTSSDCISPPLSPSPSSSQSASSTASSANVTLPIYANATSPQGSEESLITPNNNRHPHEPLLYRIANSRTATTVSTSAGNTSTEPNVSRPAGLLIDPPPTTSSHTDLQGAESTAPLLSLTPSYVLSIDLNNRNERNRPNIMVRRIRSPSTNSNARSNSHVGGRRHNDHSYVEEDSSDDDDDNDDDTRHQTGISDHFLNDLMSESFGSRVGHMLGTTESAIVPNSDNSDSESESSVNYSSTYLRSHLRGASELLNVSRRGETSEENPPSTSSSTNNSSSLSNSNSDIVHDLSNVSSTIDGQGSRSGRFVGFMNDHDLRMGNTITVIIRSGRSIAERTLLLLPKNRNRVKVENSQRRLTHYIQEPNVGRGFIKEVCFSNDGRLICSPFGYGLRLLAFDPYCSELCDTLPTSPLQLHELTSSICHSSNVVTTKFSPVHTLLVSGCLSGKVGFHQPVL